ncbi:MAG: N-acetylmuramoyl-L-alanine amidase [Pseudomonadota bacterium]
MVVLHYTAMASAAASLKRLCDPAAEVSAHFLIGEDGALCSLVAEEARAWHAGAGSWGAITDVNSASIGIELQNDGASPYPEAQMAALEGLLGDILARHGLPPEAVIAHSDLAPGRKSDPGPRFDWRRLARRGRAVWPIARVPGDFLSDAKVFGYTADVDPDAILTAFRNRFRPGATGPCAAEDAALAADLAARFPVDANAPSA